MLCAVPRISFTHPESSLARDLVFIVRAMSTISSRVTLPECLMFFSFLRSRGGSTTIRCKSTNMDREMRVRTLESTDDEGRGGGDNGDSGLTILDGELNSNP